MVVLRSGKIQVSESKVLDRTGRNARQALDSVEFPVGARAGISLAEAEAV
jgi:hypothetical protein